VRDGSSSQRHCNLAFRNIDLAEGVLTIQTGKFPNPLVPIHASIRRSPRLPSTSDRAFQRRLSFPVSQRGIVWIVGRFGVRFFTRCPEKDRARGPSRKHGPRLHDFARLVFKLCAVVPSGPDSTAVYHIIDVSWSCSCQRYLLVSDCLPELMGLAVKRLEKRWRTSMRSAQFPRGCYRKFFTERLSATTGQFSHHQLYRTLSTPVQFSQKRLTRRHRASHSRIDTPLITAF